MGARVDRVIARKSRRTIRTRPRAACAGGALWLPAGGGQHFLLDARTLCVLGYYRDLPDVRLWNGPLIE